MSEHYRAVTVTSREHSEILKHNIDSFNVSPAVVLRRISQGSLIDNPSIKKRPAFVEEYQSGDGLMESAQAFGWTNWEVSHSLRLMTTWDIRGKLVKSGRETSKQSRETERLGARLAREVKKRRAK
ncbi:hypothetical protein B0H14DRAFT_2558872 [Mycena olivaceomarginata]|nr:hypothetical protein B0H14DRAFT_2558872 [Mycena olivaceomarginata]